MGEVGTKEELLRLQDFENVFTAVSSWFRMSSSEFERRSTASTKEFRHKTPHLRNFFSLKSDSVFLVDIMSERPV